MADETEDTTKAHDPLSYLLMAYRALAEIPNTTDLLDDLLEMARRVQGILADTDDPDTEPESDTDPDTVEEETTDPPFGKEIRHVDDQYCVFSTAGRSFGCYTTEEAAQERLDQIERFSNARVVNAADDELIRWHDQMHLIRKISTEHVAVHNLIEDELEGRGYAPPYTLGTSAQKLDQIETQGFENSAVLPLMKQTEMQYTLGPVYVPNIEDAHGEFTDEVTLQKALWGWVRKGDRTIYLQHSDKPAGEMVEVLTWPFEIETTLTIPNEGVTKYAFPADTPFMGVIWSDWAWDLVKAGELRGYSIGGRARRLEADLPAEVTI